MTPPSSELPLEIGPQLPLHLKSILVPTDFSECAFKAVHYGIRLAQQFRAKLTLLHVFPTPEFYYEAMGLIDIEAAHEIARQELQRRLDGLRKAVERSHEDLPIETHLVSGVAYERIAEVAQEKEIDLLVISTHGFTGIKHLIRLGSTAERVVRYAPCPVIIVRANERDFVA